MKILIAGKNDIAVNALDYLINVLKISKSQLYISKTKSDNGIDTWQKSLLKYANENQIKVLSLKEAYEIEDLIFISLEFDRIINVKNFKTDKLFNIHFSKLPAYKGMYTSVIPILNGESISGVTFHKIDNGIDTGSIIKQQSFNIEINDTARDLYFKFLKYSFKLFKEVIFDVIKNNIVAHTQSHINSTYYSKKSIDFKNISIDLNKTSFEIHNQIRAYIFKEYQLPIVNGYKIKQSILYTNKLAPKAFIIKEKTLEISGIDGYKIELYLDDN